MPEFMDNAVKLYSLKHFFDGDVAFYMPDRHSTVIVNVLHVGGEE